MKMKKIELINELKAAENLLLEKEEELITCQDELARIIAEQAQEQALSSSLQAEIEKLSANNAKLTKKADKAKKDLATAKEALAKQKKAEETVPTSTYSFRLDVYPKSEDTFQSRIEHLLSGERQSLDGLDVGTLIEFIGNYLPIEERPKLPEELAPTVDSPVELESKAVSPVQPKEKQKAISPIETAIPPFNEPQLSTQAISQSGIIQQNTPFQLQVNIKPSIDPQKESPAVRGRVSFFAKNLDSSETTLLAVLHDDLTPTQKEATFTINAIGLPYGFYRIDAVTAFTTVDGKPLPVTSMQEASFIQVT